jgi:LacI family transcriptional regulator, galactose operon repressor
MPDACAVRTSVRLRDVAAAAGVDASVVSRVLSGDSRLSIRQETRQRVLEAAARLDYRPNTAARTLKTARTMAIGMIVPDLANVNYATIAYGAEEAAATAGYVLLVAHGSASDRLPDLHGRIDGLLIGMATSETPRHGEFGGGVPALLVNRREPCGVASVTVDDEAGATLATRHLLSLGHRRIAHVAGPQNADTARRRLRGYISALADAGLEDRPECIAETTFDEAGGHVAATRLLRLEPRPTALFVANVRAAIGALAAARRLGLRVPHDLSVVGFHDAPFAPYLDPALTTVRMPLEEMGRHAGDSLLALLGGQPVEDVMVATPPELVVRASSAPPDLNP